MKHCQSKDKENLNYKERQKQKHKTINLESLKCKMRGKGETIKCNKGTQLCSSIKINSSFNEQKLVIHVSRKTYHYRMGKIHIHAPI